MNDKKYSVQLCMRRSLKNLPENDMPPGYFPSCYKPGNSKYWDEIINLAFNRDNMNFNKLMRSDYSYRPERVLFICSNCKPVATAGAWYKPEWGINTGYLHMVGIHPEHTGKGLGLQVSLAALHQMAAEGREDAVLLTDDFRIAALKTYLKLGFEPVIIHGNQRERWVSIFETIGQPELEEKFKGCLEAPLFDDDEPRPNLDFAERYQLAFRWHSDRPHRLGTGLTDALGDESLYKTSKLGSASVTPKSVKAAFNAPLHLEYTAGEESLPAGSKVEFYVCGQGTLFKNTRINDGFIKLKSTGSSRIKPYIFGFEIIEGSLEPGETVELTTNPFDWTPIADKYQMKVIISQGNGEPQKRLPEPIVISVEPCEIDKLQIMLPCTYKLGQTVVAGITARDRFDNRVTYSGNIQIKHGDRSETIYMHKGYAEIEMAFTSKSPEKIKAALNNIEYESNPSVYSDNLQLYVGDLHVHDFLSAASGWTDQVYEWAKYDKSMDFVSVSVQNHGWLDNEKWAIAKHMNERYLDEGEFVTFLACEWQHSGYGDKIIHFLGGDQPYFSADERRTNSIQKLYEATRTTDALVVSHHSSYDRNQWCGGSDYDVIETDTEPLIELWSMHGSSEGFDSGDRSLRNMDDKNTVMDALRGGLKLGFTAGSDTHCGRPGGSAKEPRPYWGGMTAVWATDKTRRSIFSAIKNRHTYALTDTRIVLKMTVNNYIMGSEIPADVKAEIKIEAWAPTSIKVVQIIKNTELLSELAVNDNRADIFYTDSSRSGDFYHCRIVLEDGNLAVCSPIWMV